MKNPYAAPVSSSYGEAMKAYGAALEMVSKELVASAKAMPAWGRYTAAHPTQETTSPWPFGTVIQPTASNPNFNWDDTRQMVVGVHRSEPAIVAIDLNSNTALYCHSISNLLERWEPVPEPND